MAPSPEEAKLEIGVIVKLKGLVGAAQHNGQHGELINFDKEKGRWGVSPHFSTFSICTTRQHRAHIDPGQSLYSNTLTAV